MIPRLVASMLDVRYTRRLAVALNTWVCDLEVSYDTSLVDCIKTHLARFQSARPVLEIRHERIYVLENCFYLPLCTLTRRELKTLYNIIYLGEVSFVPSRLSWVRSESVAAPTVRVNRAGLAAGAMLAFIKAMRHASDQPMAAHVHRHTLSIIRHCDEDIWKLVKDIDV